MEKAKEMRCIAESLAVRGVHNVQSNIVQLTGRCCTSYMPIGVMSVIDVQSLCIHKDLRGRGYGRAFMSALLDAAERVEHDAVRFTNVISPQFEDFLIRLGFRLMGNSDYVLLRSDFVAAKEKALQTGKPVL